MFIVVSRMPHLGGVEYIEASQVVRMSPLDYTGPDGNILEGCVLHLSNGAVVESSEAAEEIAQRIEFDEGVETLE